MSSPGCGAARALRAAALASSSVALAVVGHLLGGGRFPSLAPLALAICFAAPACWAFAGRQRRILGLAATCAAVQLASHTIFSVDGCDLGAVARGGVHMLVAHAIMTVAAAGALARLDAVIWLLYRFLLHHLAVWNRLPALPADNVAVLPITAGGAWMRLKDWESHANPRRGPPLPATA